METEEQNQIRESFDWTLAALVLGLGLLVFGPLLQSAAGTGDSTWIPGLEYSGMPPDLALSSALEAVSKPEQQPIGTPWQPLTRLLQALTAHAGPQRLQACKALGLGLHMLAALCLALLGRSLGFGRGICRAAALIYLVHALAVEPIARLQSTGELFSLALCLGALTLFVRQRRKLGGRAGLLGLTLFAFAAPLAGKVGLVFPILALLLELPLRQVPELAAENDKRSYSALAPTYVALFLGWAAAWSLRAIAMDDIFGGLDRAPVELGLEAGQKYKLATEMLAGAMGLLVWPTTDSLRSSAVLLGRAPKFSTQLIAYLPVLVAIILAWKRQWKLCALTVCTLVASMPLLLGSTTRGAFPLTDTAILPLLPFLCLLVAGCGAGLLNRLGVKWAWIAALVPIGVLGLNARRATAHWSDPHTYWSHLAQRHPESPRPGWNLIRIRLEQLLEPGRGNQVRKPSELVESLATAAADLDQVLSILVSARTPGAGIQTTTDDYIQANLLQGDLLLESAKLSTEKEFETPQQIYELIIERFPACIEAYLGAARCLRLLGKLEEAGDMLVRAQKVSPNSAAGAMEVGLLAMETNAWEDAERNFRLSVEWDPINPLARLWLGRALVELKMHEKAMEIVRVGIELDPGNSDLATLMGVIALRSGDTPGARHWFDRALDLDPRNAFAWLQRGRVQQARGDAIAAVSDYLRSVELDDTSFEAQIQLADLLQQVGEPERALPYFAWAYGMDLAPEGRSVLQANLLETYGATPQALFTLGSIDIEREDADAALAWLDGARAGASDYAPLLHMRGIALRQLGRHEEALASFYSAVEALPDSFQLQHDYAYALLQLDRVAEAIPHLQKALELVPPTPEDPAAQNAVIQKLTTKLNDLTGVRTGPGLTPTPSGPETDSGQ